MPISLEVSISWCAHDMGPEVRAHLGPVLMGDLFQAEMVVSQHAREGCGRRCAILFASELLVICGRHTSPVSGSHLFRDLSPEDNKNS